MPRVSRKSTPVVDPNSAANPALDIGALIAAEVAKALQGLGSLPAMKPSAAKAKAPKAEPAVTVIPPAESAPLRVVTGYRDKTTGKAVPFKGNTIKITGLAHQPFGGVSLDLICEILERETEIVRVVKAFEPGSDGHKAMVQEFMDTLLGDE